jgi:hypothetical protein
VLTFGVPQAVVTEIKGPSAVTGIVGIVPIPAGGVNDFVAEVVGVADSGSVESTS